MPTTILPITGHENKPVPHEFIRQDTETDHLAVFLPGFAYTCDMPLFYYAETLLLTAGADLLRPAFDYHRDPTFLTLSSEAQLRRLITDASPALTVSLSQRPYTQLTLIAKSLGTLTLGHLLTHHSLPPTTRAVWLTPLLDNPTLRTQIHSFPGPQLVVIGTADPAYDPATLDPIAHHPTTTILTIPNADHSLDIPNDTLASIQTLNDVTTSLDQFLHP